MGTVGVVEVDSDAVSVEQSSTLNILETFIMHGYAPLAGYRTQGTPPMLLLQVDTGVKGRGPNCVVALIRYEDAVDTSTHN